MFIYVFISTVMTLIFTIVNHFCDIRPYSQKLQLKCRVKDNSFLRKIIKFKDRENSPCNYFKIVPIYIYSLLSILSFIAFMVDVITGGIISNNVPNNLLLIIAIGICVVYFIYLVAIYIWWGIVDYKIFKLSKGEKQELKHLREERKKIRQNKQEQDK